jgi:hypothetical protein
MDVHIVVFAVPLVIHEERSQMLLLLLMAKEVNVLMHQIYNAHWYCLIQV